jgi:citronellol/citronellal dehydrogenase
MMAVSRNPDIVADAAYEVLTTRGQELNGRTLIDEELLRERGVSDFAPYSMTGRDEGLAPDIFLG